MGDEGSWSREKRPLRELDAELEQLIAEVGHHPGLPADVHRCLSDALWVLRAAVHGPATGEHNLRWLGNLPEGWHGIYRAALEALPAGTIVTQAKEKMGEIRIYSTAPYQQYRSVIEEAEARSRVTCAECGSAGRLRVSTSGYYLTLCDSHASGWSEPGPHEP
jgi:hypothetical protein